MAEHPSSIADKDRDQVATYIAELTSELASVARRHGLDTLGYLLDMACMEAESAAAGPRTTNSETKVA